MKKLLLKSLIGLVLPFNLVWAGDPASPPTDPFEAAVSGLRIFRPVGDIEGMGIHFKKLAEDGVIQWNEQMQRWDLKSDKYTLIFNGDYMRRGPYGTQIVKWILDLKTRYPRAIEMNIGNHDGNILSWHIMRPELKLGLDADYIQWLAKNGKANTLSSQMFFWAEDQGLTDKLENYWLEMALSKTRPKWFSTEERMKSLTLSDVEEARFFKIEQKSWGPTKVINRDALSALVPIEEMAKSFEDMVLPNGSGRLGSWRILEKGKIDGVAKGSDRSGSPVLIEFFHSGISTIDNLGVIPADGGRYVQVKEGQELIEDLPAGLDPKNPDHLKYFLAWQKRLNGTDKLTQLRALEMAIAEVNRLVPIDGNTPLTGAALARVKELVAQMKRNPLPAVLDANWARKLGDLFFRTSSRIYPDPRNLVENSLPSPADPAVLAAEARIGIKIILGGHKPIGDMATLMIGFDKVSGKRILHIFHDTSYSPVEGNNQIEVYADGSVRIYGRNRFGTEIALEYPNEEIMREWGAIKKRYDDQKISEYDVPEPDKTKADRYERYSRLGMVAGGRLIIGFERTRDKDGKLVTNYDNYVTVSQKGRDFTYQNIDVYGLRLFEKANGPLKYAESDLEGMLKKAELEKIAALKSLGKEVLTKTDITEFLAGKDVVLLSGPADESLGPILNPGGNKDYVKSEVVLAFKRYLKAIPLNDNSRVFLSGGTTGLEPLLTNLVLKENESRLRYGGTELPVIGNITSVTGKGEIDPRIQKYYVIPETFYWIDYLENLMKDTLLPSKLKSLKFLLAGGGGILPLQIKQAIEAARNDSRLSVNLLDGVTMHPEDPTFRKRSGTDKTIDAMRKSGDIPASVSIMTAKDGRFVTTHGQASSFDLKSNVRKAQDRSTRESRGQSQRPAINACEALFSI